MKDTLNPDQIPFLLERLGEVLGAEGRQAAIVVVGGAALNLLGVVRRTTVDVDVIAFQAEGGESGHLIEPTAWPAGLPEAVTRLTRDFDLPADWLNTTVGAQWRTGLPPGFSERITWRRFGGLSVGLPGRWDLIALKLHAAADQDPRSRHVQDLLALRPTTEELASAAEWVRSQDAGPEFARILASVVDHVATRTR